MLKRMMLAVVTISGFGGVALAQGAGGVATDPGAPAPDAAPVAPTAAPTPAPMAAPVAPAATAKPPAISGFIDATYNYNLNRPSTGTNGAFLYDQRHNNFALNAAHISISGEPEPGLSYTIDIDGGTDAAVNVSNFNPADTATYKLDVQEAYGTYKHDKFGIRVGKFATFNGIELIESGSNPTVSRGYLYGLAEPVTNTGVEVFYQATDKVDVHLGVVNGWDVMADNNHGKTILAKVGIVPSADSLVSISAYAGPEQTGNDDNWRETLDVTALVKFGKLDLNLQGNVGREDGATPVTGEDAVWFGAGVQPVFHVSDQFTFAGRVELFKDNDGARTGGDVQLVNITATPGYALSPHFLLRADARLDIADQEVFFKSDGGTTKTQVVLLGEAIASF
jgi:hypothetical protein